MLSGSSNPSANWWRPISGRACHAIQFPIESKIIKSDIYVDDLLSGADNINDLKSLCNNNKIFYGAGFHLRKWNSNTRDLEGDNIQLEHSLVQINHILDMKTLGISYDSIQDMFSYSLSEKLSVALNITKRHILSNAAKIFDPLGLLSPLTVIPKLLVRQAWKEKWDWDQQVSSSIQSEWTKFIESTRALILLTIPRCIFAPNAQSYYLHGFSDASERAYGACVYVQTIAFDGSVTSHLCAAKSKVAPIKTVTLPRLELCAAVLLVRLMRRITDIFTHEFSQRFYWTDSRITLAWIQGCPSRWKTFVANRVSEIQQASDQSQWFHVPTTSNPADLITRGATLSELINCHLWWHGPHSIINFLEPPTEYTIPDLPDQRSTTLVIRNNISDPLFTRFSNLSKLIHIVAYCLRFISNCKNRNKITGELTVSERANALSILIKLSQSEAFSSELSHLRRNKPLQSSSKILSLHPFLDSEGLIRVGGRLSNAPLTFNKKHQILLPKNHALTELIATNSHITNLHCGSQQLLYILREKYWPISGISLTKKITSRCIKCYRVQPKITTPLMGTLPARRVTPSAPFSYCGVD